MTLMKHPQEKADGNRWRTSFVLWDCGGRYSGSSNIKLHISKKKKKKL